MLADGEKRVYASIEPATFQGGSDGAGSASFVILGTTMPIHIHSGPACGQKVGLPCTPTTCGHYDSCRQGGTLLSCALQADGSCVCFHSDWVGPGGFEVEPASATRARNAATRARNAVLDPRWIDLAESRPQTLQQALSRFRPRPPLVGADGKVRPVGPAIGLAYGVIEKFVAKTAPGTFPKIARPAVAAGVLERIHHPESVDQGGGWWCGPASFIHSLARQDPVAYAKYVTDLYDNGVAFTAGAANVRPSHDFRQDAVPLGENAADWIALGSLRDSTNWIFEYHRNSWIEHKRGGTSPGDIEQWFKKFGFREVVNKTSSSSCDLDNLKLADSYARRNWRVVLFIDSNVIVGGDAEAKAGGAADHFIVLSGPINYGPPIKMRIFTWGAYQTIPDVAMPANDFLNSYHGFVAARR